MARKSVGWRPTKTFRQRQSVAGQGGLVRGDGVGEKGVGLEEREKSDEMGVGVEHRL